MQTVSSAPVKHRALLAQLLVALALACTATTGPIQIGGVEALARRGKIQITNRTERPVFTFVVGRETSALIDWMPCVDSVRCPPLEVGATRTVPYPVKIGGAPEKEALIYWWHAVPAAGGGFRPDSIRYGIVPLQGVWGAAY